MKFGKDIAQEQEKNPSLHYLDYKGLKRKVKLIMGDHQSDVQEGISAFEAMLDSEISTVNEQVFTQSQGLHSVLASIEGEAPLQEAANRLKVLIQVSSEVDLLRKYALWSAVAVFKILKKRAKRLRSIGSDYDVSSIDAKRFESLSHMSFFNGDAFAELQASIESLSQRLCLQTSGETPAGLEQTPLPEAKEEEDLCPICLEKCMDAVQLSCSHKFCWKCFALGPQTDEGNGELSLDRCPLCRFEQILDPACNFKTDPSSGLKSLAKLLELFPQVLPLPLDGHPAHGGESTGGGRPQCFQSETQEANPKEAWVDPAACPWEASPFCALCCEPLLLEAVETTPCKHHFHRICLLKEVNPECPICHAAIPVSLLLPRKMQEAAEQLGGTWKVCCPKACKKAQTRLEETSKGVSEVKRGQTKELKDFVFPGGPCRFCGGWRLPNCPPLELLGPGNVSMPSFIHKVSFAPRGLAEDLGGMNKFGESSSESESGKSGSSSSSDSDGWEEEGLLEEPRALFWSAVGSIPSFKGLIKSTEEKLARARVATLKHERRQKHLREQAIVAAATAKAMQAHITESSSLLRAAPGSPFHPHQLVQHPGGAFQGPQFVSVAGPSVNQVGFLSDPQAHPLLSLLSQQMQLHPAHPPQENEGQPSWRPKGRGKGM